MSADEPESLNETLAALRVPGLLENLRQADADFTAGNTLGADEIHERYGLT
jgi:antitoxin YefM